MNDDKLEQMLASAYGEEPHIDDGGFSDRVLKAMPSPALTARKRALIIGGSSALALLATLPAVPAFAFIGASVADAVTSTMGLQVPAASSVVLCGLLAWMTVRIARSEG